MDHPKGHNLEGLLLVRESNGSLQRKGVEVLVYYFLHGDLPGFGFFLLQHYMHVLEEVPGGGIVDPVEERA